MTVDGYSGSSALVMSPGDAAGGLITGLFCFAPDHFTILQKYNCKATAKQIRFPKHDVIVVKRRSVSRTPSPREAWP